LPAGSQSISERIHSNLSRCIRSKRIFGVNASQAADQFCLSGSHFRSYCIISGNASRGVSTDIMHLDEFDYTGYIAISKGHWSDRLPNSSTHVTVSCLLYLCTASADINIFSLLFPSLHSAILHYTTLTPLHYTNYTMLRYTML